MPSLQDLPSELIATVVDHIESDSASLSCLSRTKRRFHTIVMPRLNRNVVIRNNQGLAYRAMLGRLPGIAAAAMKSLTGLEHLTVKGGGPALDNQPFRVHKWHVFRRHFVAALEEGALAHLKTLELNLTDSEPWCCDIDAFMAHPTLKRLSILGAHISCGDFPVSFTRITALEDLTLLCCDFSAETLIRTLAIPRGLRSFTCKGDVRESPIDSRELTAQPKSYIAALSQHKGTLQVLDINFWPFQDRYPDALDMRAFSKLRRLTIRVEELYSRMLYRLPLPECLLPRSLEELVLWTTLHESAERIQEEVRKEIDRWLDRLPNLKSLVLETGTPIVFEYGYPALHRQVDVRWRRFMNDGYWPLDCSHCHYQLTRA
ncbi:hypothetical protein BDW72DRAFT_202438 [Aspergillus terricola var. indicus]